MQSLHRMSIYIFCPLLAEAQVNLVDMRAIYIKYVDEYLYKNMNSKVSMLTALMYVYTEEEIQNKTYQIYAHNQE